MFLATFGWGVGKPTRVGVYQWKYTDYSETESGKVRECQDNILEVWFGKGRRTRTNDEEEQTYEEAEQKGEEDLYEKNSHKKRKSTPPKNGTKSEDAGSMEKFVVRGNSNYEDAFIYTLSYATKITRTEGNSHDSAGK
ncbi:hypothetical protein QAD02_003458 [Eretmocerus hayati]|uniref:Uncharacterized protein n=1 Tax=Eretmocerus hayati TaxID=131215 RepID=A0ACC2NPG2_9HYME|nr:hypothetical protein QAD02_003458 [Eretmocerus hayati]